MDSRFNRTEMIIGEDNLKILNNSKVIVFGLGGVGGSLCEALVRSGVGHIAIVDRDIVDITNINRQVIATQNTIGENKTDAMEQRLKSINPDVVVEKFNINVSKDNIEIFDFSKYDYIADAIDTVTAKILLVEKAKEANTKIIMSMGMGNKLDPTKIEVCDISKTSVCHLARVMRRELKKRNIKKVLVAYSTEEAKKPIFNLENESTPGSVSFVPPVCGMIMASAIVDDLISL